MPSSQPSSSPSISLVPTSVPTNSPTGSPTKEVSFFLNKCPLLYRVSSHHHSLFLSLLLIHHSHTLTAHVESKFVALFKSNRGADGIAIKAGKASVVYMCCIEIYLLAFESHLLTPDISCSLSSLQPSSSPTVGPSTTPSSSPSKVVSCVFFDDNHMSNFIV